MVYGRVEDSRNGVLEGMSNESTHVKSEGMKGLDGAAGKTAVKTYESSCHV